MTSNANYASPSPALMGQILSNTTVLVSQMVARGLLTSTAQVLAAIPDVAEVLLHSSTLNNEPN